jgi:hypothetical protein
MLFANASELLAWVNELLVRREQLFNLSLTSLAWRVCIPNQFASGFYANGIKRWLQVLFLLLVRSPGISCSPLPASETLRHDDIALRIFPS